MLNKSPQMNVLKAPISLSQYLQMTKKAVVMMDNLGHLCKKLKFLLIPFHLSVLRTHISPM